MNQDKNLQILGIARKAGLIAVGGDAVGDATRMGKAKLVFSATDASESASRRARMNAQAGGAIYVTVPYAKFELGNITGRGSPGTVAILDAGLAAGFLKGLVEKEPEKYGGAAEKLAEEARNLTEKRKHTSRRTAK